MLLGIQERDIPQRDLFIFAALLFFAIPIRIPNPETRTQREFRNFIITFNRTYYGNKTEYERRYKIFKETFDWLEGLRHDSRAVFGINRYSDLTQIEFVKKYLVASTRRNATRFRRSIPKLNSSFGTGPPGIPQRVDWRERGIITPVRMQRDVCGSCFVETIVATIEAMVALKRNSTNANELSLQQVTDCVGRKNVLCEGGGTCRALNCLKGNNITIIPDHLYMRSKEGQLTSCTHHPVVAKTARHTDFTCFNFVGQEHEMLVFIAHNGPLIASVDALPWKHYVGGVVTHSCDGQPNHVVQIVGYDLGGRENPHFIVRNSWGSHFGEEGYIKIAIGGNVCNIAGEVSSVTVD